MNLLNLSSEIQSAILEASLDLSERRLRAVVTVKEWGEQGRLLRLKSQIRKRSSVTSPRGRGALGGIGSGINGGGQQVAMPSAACRAFSHRMGVSSIV